MSMNKITKIIIVSFAFISIVVIGAMIYSLINKKSESATAVHSSQEECERINYCECAVQLCETNCPKGFQKGWLCKESTNTNKDNVIIYEKKAFWGPCPTPGKCFENSYVYASGKFVIEGADETVEKQLGSQSMIKIKKAINDSGIINKDCTATTVPDYWATYNFNIDSNKKIINFPGCREDLEKIDKMLSVESVKIVQ